MRITIRLQRKDVPVFKPVSNFFSNDFIENFIYYEVQHSSRYNKSVPKTKILKVIKNELLLMFQRNHQHRS